MVINLYNLLLCDMVAPTEIMWEVVGIICYGYICYICRVVLSAHHVGKDAYRQSFAESLNKSSN